ncbi:MAG: hypothetical protein LQ350_004812 [Teloschistes chrysophthalmus]|nr:MAG: hypothetical protein LQ350_004812 [Niorma chrysophthalma]
MASAADSLNLTPAAIIFPTLVLITLFLDLPPFVWHIKNRNLAASNLIAWTILFNLFSFVNALVWPTDDIPNWFHGFVLCDIEAKLQLAATFGISGSLACIMRSLAKVLDTKRTVLSLTKRQRNVVVLVRMRKYRRDFSSVISASNSNLTESRFQRLFFLSSALVLVYLPIQLYILYRNASVPLLPYSWELIHGKNWSDIILAPSHGEVRFDRWIMIVLGIFVFVFFGTGNDATKMSEKDEAASVTTASIPSPTEFEEFSKHETFMTGAATSSQPAVESWDLEAKPLPLVPARSQTSLFSYVSRTRESPPPDDIEAILRDYDAHQPNRFIAGLWHANNGNGNAAGIHMGNANGLRY